jgi:hypothetical protein
MVGLIMLTSACLSLVENLYLMVVQISISPMVLVIRYRLLVDLVLIYSDSLLAISISS